MLLELVARKRAGKAACAREAQWSFQRPRARLKWRAAGGDVICSQLAHPSCAKVNRSSRSVGPEEIREPDYVAAQLGRPFWRALMARRWPGGALPARRTNCGPQWPQFALLGVAVRVCVGAAAVVVVVVVVVASIGGGGGVSNQTVMAAAQRAP